MFVDDSMRLMHIRDAAVQAVAFLSGKTVADLDSDGMLFHAVQDCLTTVGQAAFKVSTGFKESRPGLPWGHLVRFRHQLVHDSLPIDSSEMWHIVVERFPSLIGQIDAKIDAGGTRQ